jgi:hypothetical protein
MVESTAWYSKFAENMLVTHIITDLNDGGAEAVLYRLCGHDSEGTHVVISLMDEGNYSPLLRHAGVEVHSLGMPQGRLTQKGLSRLWRLLRRLRPEAVQTWMYHANLVGGIMARMAGILNVYWGVRHTALEAGSSKKEHYLGRKAMCKAFPLGAS